MPFGPQEMNYFGDSCRYKGSPPRGSMIPFLDDPYRSTPQDVEFPEEPPVQRCSTPEASDVSDDEEDTTIINSLIQSGLNQSTSSDHLIHPCYIKQHQDQKVAHHHPQYNNCFLNNGSLPLPRSYPSSPDVFSDALNSYQVEGTPRDSVCNTPPPPVQENLDAEDDVFANERGALLNKESPAALTPSYTPPQEDQTPLMFSRSSSPPSLSSVEDVIPEFDVASEYSQQTSRAVSPSELPDSPPSSRKPLRQTYPLDLRPKSRPPAQSYSPILPLPPHGLPRRQGCWPPLAHAASQHRIYYTDEQPLDLSCRSSQPPPTAPPQPRIPVQPPPRLFTPSSLMMCQDPFLPYQIRAPSAIVSMFQHMALKEDVPVCYATEGTPAYLSASTSRALSPLLENSRGASMDATRNYAIEGTPTLMSLDGSRVHSPLPVKSLEDSCLHYNIENTPILLSGMLSPIAFSDTSFIEELGTGKPKEEAKEPESPPRKSAPEPSPLGSPANECEAEDGLSHRPKSLPLDKQKSSIQLSPLAEGEEEELPQDCCHSPQPCSSASASILLSSDSEGEEEAAHREVQKETSPKQEEQLDKAGKVPQQDDVPVAQETPLSPAPASQSKPSSSCSSSVEAVDSEEEEDELLLMACIIAGMPKTYSRKTGKKKSRQPEEQPAVAEETSAEPAELPPPKPSSSLPPSKPSKASSHTSSASSSECGSEDSKPRERPPILRPKPVLSSKSTKEVNSKGMPRPPILLPKPSKEILIARGLLPGTSSLLTSKHQASESDLASRPVAGIKPRASVSPAGLVSCDLPVVPPVQVAETNNVTNPSVTCPNHLSSSGNNLTPPATHTIEPEVGIKHESLESNISTNPNIAPATLTSEPEVGIKHQSSASNISTNPNIAPATLTSEPEVCIKHQSSASNISTPPSTHLNEPDASLKHKAESPTITKPSEIDASIKHQVLPKSNTSTTPQASSGGHIPTLSSVAKLSPDSIEMQQEAHVENISSTPGSEPREVSGKSGTPDVEAVQEKLEHLSLTEQQPALKNSTTTYPSVENIPQMEASSPPPGSPALSFSPRPFNQSRSKSLDALPQNSPCCKMADGPALQSDKGGQPNNSWDLSSTSSDDDNLLQECIRAGMPSKNQKTKHKSEKRTARGEDLRQHQASHRTIPRLDHSSVAKLTSLYQDDGTDTEDDRIIQDLVIKGIQLARHSSDTLPTTASLSRRQPHRSSDRIIQRRGSRVQPRSQSQRAFREPHPDKARKTGRNPMYSNHAAGMVPTVQLPKQRRHLDHMGQTTTYHINHLADDRYPVPAPVVPPNPQSKRQFDRSLLRALSLREQKSSKGPMPRVEVSLQRPADRIPRPNPHMATREQQNLTEIKPPKRWWRFGSRGPKPPTASPTTSVFADSTKPFNLP